MKSQYKKLLMCAMTIGLIAASSSALSWRSGIYVGYPGYYGSYYGYGYPSCYSGCGYSHYKCGWVRGHYNSCGYWIRGHRVCWY